MIFKIISSFGISDICFFLVAFVVSYVLRYYFNYFTRPNPLPGPFPLPFFGNAHQSIGLQINDWMLLMYEKYGDMYEIDLGQGRVIVLCRADLIENVSSGGIKYPIRFNKTDGFIEYGLNKTGITLDYIDHKTWKYKRQFFNQALMTPSFNHHAIERTNELWRKMETYWNNLGENHELDLTKWMRRFTIDIIFRIATGANIDSFTPYYNTFILEKNNQFNEKEIEESENLIQSIIKYIEGVSYFIIFNNFMRHYVPFVRGKGKKLLKNRDYLFDKLYDIIRKKRIEIENTPLDQPLSQDMLTSCMTANTPRDINAVKHTDVDLLRPMTDDEIFGNILDSMIGGTDTVNFTFILFFF
jgi:cytochrome P450